MRGKCLTGFLGILLGLSTNSLAKPNDDVSRTSGVTPAVEDSSAVRSGLNIGYSFGYFSYVESEMKDYGILNGLKFSFERRRSESPLMVRLESDLMFGQLQYDGALVNIKTHVSTPHSTGTTDVIMNLRGLMGLVQDLGNSSEIIPFTGVGARYLNDQMDGVGAYEREINYVYLPIGLEHTVNFKMWSVTSTAEYDVFMKGTVKSHVSQVGRGGDLTNTQDKGQGYRLAMDWSRTMNRTYDIHIQPYWQHWYVLDSDVQFADPEFAGKEPENKTDLYGLNLIMGL